MRTSGIGFNTYNQASINRQQSRGKVAFKSGIDPSGWEEAILAIYKKYPIDSNTINAKYYEALIKKEVAELKGQPVPTEVRNVILQHEYDTNPEL